MIPEETPTRLKYGPLPSKPDKTEGTTWLEMGTSHYLKALDGEIIAEIHLADRENLYLWGETKYHGLENTKSAVLRGLRG